MDDQAARDRVARVDSLLGEVEALPEGEGRELATELCQALVELYGEGLRRIVAAVAAGEAGNGGVVGTAATGANGAAPARALADDELVSHLLLLHDLHPEPVEERVRGALAAVRPLLESHGGDVELIAVEGHVVRLRLEGNCSGCPSSRVTLESAVEEEIRKAAPEVDAIEAEDAPEPSPALLQIEVPDRLQCPAAEATT